MQSDTKGGRLKCLSSMSITLDLEMASELIGFMINFPHADLSDCVDFICDKFDISATDELIDEVADFFFAN